MLLDIEVWIRRCSSYPPFYFLKGLSSLTPWSVVLGMISSVQHEAYLTEMGFHYFDFVPRASERDLARRAAHDAAAGEDLKYEPPGKVPPPMRPHKRQKLADV